MILHWCPYTDCELPPDETSAEHVIPLALGGHDLFTLPVCKIFNSEVGSRLDGLLADDFLIKMRRNALDIRGHSNKRPIVTDRRGRHVATGRPLHITIDRRDGFKTWCPRSRQDVKLPGAAALNFKFDLVAGMQFVAKVSLGAGYYAYGDAFRECVKHSDLRYVMNTAPTEGEPPPAFLEVWGDGRFGGDDADVRVRCLRQLCRAAQRSSVVCLVPGSRAFTVAVGILGNYMGLLTVPAETKDFPRSDSYDLGHVVVSQGGQLMRFSFRKALERFVEVARQRAKPPGSKDT